MQATVVLIFVLYFSFSTSSPRCPEGENWQECGTACPKTCSRPNPEVCTLQCVSGCFCDEGTIRDTTTNKCVRPEDCKCPSNEIFTECGSACDATCAEPNPPCTEQCVVRCSCVEGYVRDERNNYECIPEDKCPCKEE